MSRSVDDVNNEEWLVEVGTAMGEKEQVAERYSSYPEEKVNSSLTTQLRTFSILHSPKLMCLHSKN